MRRRGRRGWSPRERGAPYGRAAVKGLQQVLGALLILALVGAVLWAILWR